MSPEIIEQLHRIEHKLDKILEFMRLGQTSVEDINSQRICPICEQVISWGHNGKGQVIRRCGCDLQLKSMDMMDYAPPAKKGN